MAALGLTKYGFGVKYLDQNTDPIDRTYNGVNFADDTPETKVKFLRAFVTGKITPSGGGEDANIQGLRGIALALGLQGISSYELIQRNTVTGD